MATAQLKADVRSDKGKGVARKMRSAGKVPAIIYGHKREPQSLAIDCRELVRLLEKHAAASTVIELAIDGGTARTLIREIQRHPVKRDILHVDFQELVAGERVTVRVPVVYVGTAAGVKEGGILDQIMHELEINVDPSDIPQHIDVDVTNVTIGHPLHVGDLKLPPGVKVLDDVEATLCIVSPPRTAEIEVPTEEAAATAEPAEPEVIRQRKPEEEGEGA
jgi:large subunit ribosomal protein L25